MPVKHSHIPFLSTRKLREVAKEINLPGRGKMRKAKLVEALQAAIPPREPEPVYTPTLADTVACCTLDRAPTLGVSYSYKAPSLVEMYQGVSEPAPRVEVSNTREGRKVFGVWNLGPRHFDTADLRKALAVYNEGQITRETISQRGKLRSSWHPISPSYHPDAETYSVQVEHGLSLRVASGGMLQLVEGAQERGDMRVVVESTDPADLIRSLSFQGVQGQA